MARKILKNKPLVEAMVEVRWALQSTMPGSETDPHFKLLLGRMFDRLSSEYPEYEQLPTANIPDGFVGHVVQHRFRVRPKAWPLVQLGPGIMTINSTADYAWEDFHPRAVDAISTLYQSHPKVSELRMTNIVLRYIDAVPFSHKTENAFAFLRDKLKVDLKLPHSLFEGDISDQPIALNWQSVFKCTNPKGVFALNMGLGQKDSEESLIWDTSVQSTNDDIPPLPDGFESWFNAAHEVTSSSFFKLIEGELERRFSGD